MLAHLKKLRQHQVSLPPLGAIIGSALSSCTLAYSRFPCICSSICIGACICKSFCICFAFSSISGRCAMCINDGVDNCLFQASFYLPLWSSFPRGFLPGTLAIISGFMKLLSLDFESYKAWLAKFKCTRAFASFRLRNFL